MNQNREILNIFIRYALLVALSIGSLWIFYFIFTPLTFFPVYFLLNSFFGAFFDYSSKIIFTQSVPIEIISACVAGSAYYLLVIFNLSTSGIDWHKRTKMIAYSFLAFLLANIIRIFLLVWIYLDFFTAFDITHKVFWYGISTVLVVGIWFYQVKVYKIKEIPFVSDFRFLYNLSSKNSKRRK